MMKIEDACMNLWNEITNSIPECNGVGHTGDHELVVYLEKGLPFYKEKLVPKEYEGRNVILKVIGKVELL